MARSGELNLGLSAEFGKLAFRWKTRHFDRVAPVGASGRIG
jgi:hypothetical protein